MHSRVLVPLVGSVLLVAMVAGCGGDPKPAPSPKSTASSSTSASPAGITDVCPLVPQKLLDQVKRQGSEPRTMLSLGDETYVVCDVNGSVQLQFGLQVVGDPELPETDDYTKQIQVAGAKRAVEQKFPVRIEMTAETDDGVGIKVRNELLSDPEQPVDEATTRALLDALVKAATPAVRKRITPIDLGAACLPATDPAVTALLGTVSLARGGNEPAGAEPECQYYGSGARIDLSHLKQKGAEKDFMTIDPSIDKEVEMAGARKAKIDADPPAGSIDLTWSTSPNEVWFARGDVIDDTTGDPQRVTLAATEDLGRAWMKRLRAAG